MSAKPTTVRDYITWLMQEHKPDQASLSRQYYDAVATKAQTHWESSPFWTQLISHLRDYHAEYQIATGYPLLASEGAPSLHRKPFDSFLLNSLRKNVLDNPRWPQPPEGGMVLPSNWFSKIHDVIRTQVVVKYLDGVEFLGGRIRQLCESHGLRNRFSLEAREEGYYAAHFYVEMELEIPRVDWDTAKVTMCLEIQITTQLQEVIKRLLHRYYEDRRTRGGAAPDSWKWDYRSDEFVANYLGHILHYVEGMIMEVRDRQRREATK